jgi:hypothetical protein
MDPIIETMDRTPVFVYDRVTTSCELVFVPTHLLSKSFLRMDDRLNAGKSVFISIPPKTATKPHYIITHFDGEDFAMFPVNDDMFGHLKTLAFTKEIIEKHLADRDHETKARRSNKARPTIASRLRFASN